LQLFGSLIFSIFFVTNLQPSWNAINGGGVWSAYYGAGNGVDASGNYNPVSPGAIQNYDGRSAAPIFAGVSASSTADYDDQGLFAFDTNNTPITTFATEPLTYDFENQYGTAPVWMYIELNKGATGDSVYQYVPTTNPASWHTEDAANGNWQAWTNLDNGVATSTALSLASIALANPNATVDRVYLTEGIGDSYHADDNGTVAWVNTVTIGDNVYNFATAPATTTDSTTSTTSEQASSPQTYTPNITSGGGSVSFGNFGSIGLSAIKLVHSIIVTSSTVATSSRQASSQQAHTPVIAISHHPKTKKKIIISVVAPKKVASSTVPQTASVYSAWAAFWSALKKFF